MDKNNDKGQQSSIQVNVPNNLSVLYTDSMFVTPSKFGIVLDFAQSVGPTNQQNVVVRVGMSREHARAMIEVVKSKLDEVEDFSIGQIKARA